MHKKILLWFDVEDYVTPQAEDSLFELLKLLEEYGIRATLKLCTQKYQQLVDHGRTDILKMIGNHELAFHMTNHSVHPLPSEYLDRMGFEEGACEFDRREGAGVRELIRLSGQNLTSYGHPGVAWAPQVFPALRKWGIFTYLDVHDILAIDGQPFWYGGVLCHTKLNNLAHLEKERETCSLIENFDAMREDGCTEVVFLSMYDHPHELCCTTFWDSVNFAHGQNPPYCQPAPLRKPGEFERLIGQYRAFFNYISQKTDVEFVTALESLRYERRRFSPITEYQVREAAGAMRGNAGFFKFGRAYCSASEVLTLMARLLTGRFLLPELIYGPEKAEDSVITGPVNVRELAEEVLKNTRRVFGYKQLPSLYRIGNNFINPTDAFATLAAAVLREETEIPVVSGRLAAADYVNRNVQFGGGWDLWKQDFRGLNIIEQTALQTWTLKPAVF